MLGGKLKLASLRQSLAENSQPLAKCRRGRKGGKVKTKGGAVFCRSAIHCAKGLRDYKSLLQSQKLSSAVIPVKTGIQFNAFKIKMDSRFRGNDGAGFRVAFPLSSR